MSAKNLGFNSQTSGRDRKNSTKLASTKAEFEVENPNSLAGALRLQMSQHQDTYSSLCAALPKARNVRIMCTLRDWCTGKSLPRQTRGLALLNRIERHYGLPEGYFATFIGKENVSFMRRPCNYSPFQSALYFEMTKHGDTSWSLASAISKRNSKKVRQRLTNWKTGRSAPNQPYARELLNRIEALYGLRDGYFLELLAKPENPMEVELRLINRVWRGVVRWHLPENFNDLPSEKQQEILSWIFENVLQTNSRFGKFQSIVTRHAFSIVFPDLKCLKRRRQANGAVKKNRLVPQDQGGYGTIAAPPRLSAEMLDLLESKRASLPPVTYARFMQWSQASAEAAAVRFGIIFGAFAAAPFSPVKGLGISPSRLTFGMFVFPKVLDWHLQWREQRRGFYNSNEVRFLEQIRSLLLPNTGWIRQRKDLARSLSPISNLISSNDVNLARRDWKAACERCLKFIRLRISEIKRVQRRHRDSFEPILPVLNADSPLSEYRKIAEEILKQMPDPGKDPFRAAVAVRSYLLIRFGMHLGFRQRNLRELMLTRKGDRSYSVAELERLRRGELRWSESNRTWEVFVPALAFKNSNSSFFDDRPFWLALPDLDGLYGIVDIYLASARAVLLAGRPDPGTFFVRSARSSHRATVYDLFSFYEAWKRIIQRYGIYNPYTKRGAIAGLRPHGSHAIRDVIATHVLKQTGSYELASYAIQDTVETVKAHYSRFLPHEKAARAAEILNKVWL